MRLVTSWAASMGRTKRRPNRMATTAAAIRMTTADKANHGPAVSRALGGRRDRTTTCTTSRGTPRIWTSASKGTAAYTKPPCVPDTERRASNAAGSSSDAVSPGGRTGLTLGVAGSNRVPPGPTASTADPSRLNGDFRAISSERNALAGSVRLAESASCWTLTASPCASRSSSWRVWVSALRTANAKLASPDRIRLPSTMSTIAAVRRRRTDQSKR